MASLRFGLKLSQNATIDQLRDLWSLADEAGFVGHPGSALRGGRA